MKTLSLILLFGASLFSYNVPDIQGTKVYEYRILEGTPVISKPKHEAEDASNSEDDDFSVRDGNIRVMINNSVPFDHRIIAINDSERGTKVLVFEKYVYPSDTDKNLNKGGKNLNDGNYIFLAYDINTHERYVVGIGDRVFSKKWLFLNMEKDLMFAYITTDAKDVTRQVLSHKKPNPNNP